MKMLFLRGQIPTDRDKQEIIFSDIKQCDDMWTQLMFTMTSNEDISELWYWGGEREHKFSNNFTERWVPNLKNNKTGFDPDVIFCRGGFIEYHSILKLYPNSIKIYYGAGRRYLPQDGFNDYDLILQDSIQQLTKCKQKYPHIESSLFIKPAADNIFRPINCIKEYDVCFPANGAQPFKGHDFIYKTIPNCISLLNLGNNPYNFKFPFNVTSYRVPRTDMASNISKCKVGIVVTDSNIDSCPRVIPEMLACDIPIVVLDSVRFWKEKYITKQTGLVTNRDNLWNDVQYVLDNLGEFCPRKYYDENLSLLHSSKHIKDKIITLYDKKMTYVLNDEFQFNDKIIYPKDPTATKERVNQYRNYYKVKYSICKKQSPRKIVEIGVRAGYSAWSFLQAAPDAKYIGVDANTGQHGGEGGKDGCYLKWAKETLKKYDCEFHEINTQSVNSLPFKDIDLFHVDGDHTKHGVMHDLDLAIKCISDNGLILVDDITYLNEVKVGVYKWLSLHKNEVVCEFISSLRGEMLIRKKQ